MKVLSIAIAAAFLFLQSCSNDKKTETTETPTEQLPDLSATPVTSEVQTTPAEVHVNSNPSAPSTQVTAGSGPNPAHGEPGHRCDIAVGAPLNSPPGKTTDNPVNISTQPGISGPTEITIPEGGGPAAPQINMSAPAPSPGPATTPAAPVTGKTPPGMNPPHGEPGHDCSIAVGAPLKK